MTSYLVLNECYIPNYNYTYLYFTALTVQFSSSTFTDSEYSGNISVTVMLEGGTSFTDINVIVIPSDQSPVSAASKIVCSSMHAIN